jgi:hypothetical protein
MVGFHLLYLEITFINISNVVSGARIALPYLYNAEELGHSGAAKELLRAHKVLAVHYQDVAKKEISEQN